MGSEVSEAKESKLLQAIHVVSSKTPDGEQAAAADHEDSRKRKAEEEENGDHEELGGEKRGMLQKVGDMLSQSASSVKEAVLGNGRSQESDGQAVHNSSTSLNQGGGLQDEVAQESLLVHTVVHD